MKASSEKVLTMLRQAGERGVSTGEFAAAYCPRASARICELRHEHGFEIESRCVSSNSYLYTLKPSGPSVASPGAGSSGDQRASAKRPDPPAPPASDRALPPADAGQLFEMPAPGEDADADRWHGADVWDAA